ncbi:hypothetical protein LTR67_008693 [Exophiala xenobiotica]
MAEAQTAAPKALAEAVLHDKEILGIDVVDSTAPTDITQTPEEREAEARLERRLKWKIDLVILPMMALMYFLSSMARNDLGNAKVAGMTEDLNISPKQYSNLASIFLVGYIVFQIPGTVLVRMIGPPVQFSCAMMMWGVFTACHVVANTYGTLMGLRFLVGVAEAFLEGGVFYLSFWYTYTELATRGAIFYSTSALAGSFNGLIAYGIEKNLAGDRGWESWRWLYLVEGVLPIGCSLILLLLLPGTPEKRHFLFTKEERELAIRRSRRAFNPEDAKLRPKLIIKPLLKPHFWLLSAIYAFNHFSVSSLSNFLPAIIKGFGYSTVRAQLMSVIVYACALVGINFFARIGDKINRRGLPLLAASACASLGFILLLAVTNLKGRMAATCILAFGIYATIPLSTTWLTLNIGGYTQRGAATAMMNMIAQAFSISGNQAYIDPPIYRRGIGSSLGLTVAHAVAVMAMLWVVKRRNDAKDKLRASLSPEELEQRRAESWDLVGDDHIDFKHGY